MRGIVTSVRREHNQTENSYCILARRSVIATSGLLLGLYDRIDFKGGDAIRPKILDKASGHDYDGALGKCIKRARLAANAKRIGKRYAKALGPAMHKLIGAAENLARAYISGAPIVVRFHNDGDGAAGATALYMALQELQGRFMLGERQVSWHMTKGISYAVDAFYSDQSLFSQYESIERPLVVIIDFGTNPGSEEALGLAEGKCDMILLDHHAAYDGFPKAKIKHYINSWELSRDGNLTAGMLAAIFARIVGDVDASEIGEAALVSDHSTHADLKDKEAVRLALILDYLTSERGESRLTPRFFSSVISDKKRADEIYSHARNSLEEAVGAGMHELRRLKSRRGTLVFLLDFRPVSRLGFKYPLPGRYSSELHDRLEKEYGPDTVTMVYFGNYVSVRLGKAAAEKTMILEVIDGLVRENKIVSGGGHKEAASVKVEPNGMEEGLNSLLHGIGVSADVKLEDKD